MSATEDSHFLPSGDVAPKALMICFSAFLFSLFVGILGSISAHYEFALLTKGFFLLSVIGILIFIISFIYYIGWIALKLYKALKNK